MIIVAVLAMVAFASAPVAAENGAAGTSSGEMQKPPSMTTSTSHGDDSMTATSITTTSNTETGTPQPNETEVKDKVEALREQGMSLLTADRKTQPTHTIADRQKACVDHQTEINTKITNFSSSAQTRLDVFNKIFARVKAFKTSKQLNVSSYDALVATATSKQTDAVNAVAALKTLSVKVDCTSQDPGAAVSSVKSAVDTTRTALQAYRSAIKDIVTALHTALDKQTMTTGGAQ